jgi:hypothetical protein
MCISSAKLGTLLVVRLSGCAIDQRKAVAYDLLYQPDGFENASVFDAAVRTTMHENKVTAISALMGGLGC